MYRTFLTIQAPNQDGETPHNLAEAIQDTTEELFSIPQFLIAKVSEIGWSLVTAILLLFIGFWITTRIRNIIERRMIKRNVDLSLRSFVLPIINIVLKIMVIIPVIGQLGLNVSGFLAALGGAGLAIGLALQGSLSNFAGGVLIILFKPFKVGDYIISQGNEGTVESINILNTILVTDRGQVITLPNANLFNNPIVNYSVKEFRRLDINLGISYEEDFDRVKEVILQVLNDEELIVDEKNKTVEILEFTDPYVKLAVRAYVKRPDYWTCYWKVYRKMKYTLDKNAILIPHTTNEVIIKDNPNENSEDA